MVTVSAPKPWPSHIIPTRQRWRVLIGPKGEKLWMGDQGGFVWGDRNKQLEGDLVTFEERTLATPYGRKAPLLTKIDHLVQELIVKRKAEDVSSYAQFFPGIITEDEEVGNAPEEPKDVPHEADGPHETEKFGEDDAPGTIVSFNILIAVLECETVPNDTRERG